MKYLQKNKNIVNIKNVRRRDLNRKICALKKKKRHKKKITFTKVEGYSWKIMSLIKRFKNIGGLKEDMSEKEVLK